MNYLRVHSRPRRYSALDPLTNYREEDLGEIALDLADGERHWYDIVDESEVPEGER